MICQKGGKPGGGGAQKHVYIFYQSLSDIYLFVSVTKNEIGQRPAKSPTLKKKFFFLPALTVKRVCYFRLRCRDIMAFEFKV